MKVIDSSKLHLLASARIAVAQPIKAIYTILYSVGLMALAYQTHEYRDMRSLRHS